MGDTNPIHTLGDYSKPSHEGYMNTIELHVGNNVVPLRSDTIRVQASNWLERLPAGSITTREDLTTRFLAQFFLLERTAKLRNDILMFKQHHGESLSEAWTRFKDLLQKVPHYGINLWFQVQIFYDHVNPATRRTIDQSAGGKLRGRNAKESWALLEDLALYDNKSWNDPRDFTKSVKEISLPQDVSSTSDRHLIELENQVQRLMGAHLALTQPTQVNKITTSFKKNDNSYKEEPQAGGLEVEYFDTFLTRVELGYHKYLMYGPIPSIFLRNPIITEGCPSNLKIPCNIRHVHVEKAYIDLNSPLNVMTRMMYNLIMRRKLDSRENLDRGVSNFTRRIKGMHVFVGNFTYVTDFMIVEDISSIIDPRLSQVVLGKPFVDISNMTHDLPKGVDQVLQKKPRKNVQRIDLRKRTLRFGSCVLSLAIWLLRFDSLRFASAICQMHNNIMADGSRDRPLMLATGRYPQWRSLFLRYIDTRPNGEALRKCILSGPYKPTTILVHAVAATDDSLAILEHTIVETPMNMSLENKAHFESEKEAIHLILTGIRDEIYLTVYAYQIAQEMWEAIQRLQQGESLNIQDVKTNLFWEFGKFTSHDGETMESYYTRFYKLMIEMIKNNLTVATMQVNLQFIQQLQPEWSKFVTIVKQQHKLDEISQECQPISAQANQDPYYQTSKSHKSYAPSSKPSIPTRSHITTRYKGKEIAKLITPPSETASEEYSDPEQAQRDKDMQNNLALIAKYFNKIYKPTNKNLKTSSNSRNKNVDTTPRYKNDNQSRQFGIQRMMNVAGARENECRKPKRVKDFAYPKEKMLLCKQAEKCVPLQAEQYDWLEDTYEEIDEQELETHYSYMAKIQEVPTADLGTDSEPLKHVQNDTGYNVFANVLQHSEQSESISNTCLVETDDSNIIPDSPDICDDDIQND
nr:zinc finger, CCHC-type [Tanacetum cinerariifolium]